MAMIAVTTALIGKWLNGYGSVDEHGEIPKGFDTWRGLLDVSAYDYYNYVMNQDGKLRTWGDADFAKNLVKMAYLQVKPGFPRPGITDVLGLANTLFKPGYWGTEEEKNYSPDVTGGVTEGLIKDQAKAKKPFFVWWAPSASHREDVATSILGRPGRDPRPPKRYEELVKKYKLPKPPSFNEADMSGKAKKLGQTLPLLTQAKQDQLAPRGLHRRWLRLLGGWSVPISRSGRVCGPQRYGRAPSPQPSPEASSCGTAWPSLGVLG